MADVRRIVLDVLKPHDPPLVAFTERLAEAENVEAVSTSLIELDREVQNVEVTVEGAALDYGTIESAVTDFGGTVHSVDQVACGAYVVEDRRSSRDE